MQVSLSELTPQMVQLRSESGLEDVHTAMEYTHNEIPFKSVGLERLAALGTYGEYANNMHKQPKNIVDGDKVGRPFQINIPYSLDPSGIHWLLSCILLPHV